MVLHPYRTNVKVITPNRTFLLLFLAFSLLLGGCQLDKTPLPEPTLTATPLNFFKEDAQFKQSRERLTEHAIAVQGLTDEDVIEALRTVPRHRFVPDDYLDKAYYDTALPIGYGQTISQPSLVAHMTELLDLEPGEKVLEIGTGSGYQAAILAELGFVEVYSIEIVPELHERATQTLKALGYDQVLTKQGDGYYGWEDYAPFDAIIVTAAPDHMPPPLAAQLAEDGVMVIPIGPQGFYQTLWKFVKEDGELTANNMGSVVFVPFTGDLGRTPTPDSN